MTDPNDSYDLTPPGEPRSGQPATPEGEVAPAPAATTPVVPARTTTPPDFGGPLVPPSDDDDGIAIEPEPEQPRVAATPSASRTAPKPAVATVAPTAAEAPKRPLVRSNRVEWPLAIAGCCGALFVAACLSGQQGIFPNAVKVEVGFAERAVMLLRGVLMMLLCGGCLVAGAALFHIVDRRPLGDMRALAARMLMISAVALLSRVFPIDIPFLKQSYDILAPIAIAWVMAFAMFRLAPRDAGIVIGGAILSLIVLSFGSTIVSFAIWAGSTAAVP